MRNYIQLHNYSGGGTSIEEQVEEAKAKGLVTVDTRFFFCKNDYITPSLLAKMITDFEIVNDIQFDSNNIVFRPNKYFCEHLDK